MPTKPYTWRSTSAEATRGLGELMGQHLFGGLSIGLTGQLGAGKTQLVKGLAVGNGAVDGSVVTSPTFTLVHEYPGRLLLYHLDAYRLSQPEELIALGFDEMIRSDTAVAVEWADRVRPAMPEDTLWIELTLAGETAREISFRPTGPVSAVLLSFSLLRRIDTDVARFYRQSVAATAVVRSAALDAQQKDRRVRVGSKRWQTRGGASPG